MSRKLNRLIAMLLCLITVLTIIPFGAMATTTQNKPDVEYIGAGGDKSSVGATGGWREWVRSRAGYRVYVVNDDGQLASNVIDYLFTAPTGIGQYIWSTKVEGLNLNKSPNKMVALSGVINKANEFTTNNYLDVPYPVTMNGSGKVQSHGNELNVSYDVSTKPCNGLKSA